MLGAMGRAEMSRAVAITRKVRERGLLLIGLLLCLAGAPQTHAQIVGGTILGTITDSSGAVVPEAQISIRNLANGTIRSVKTRSWVLTPISPGARQESRRSQRPSVSADLKTRKIYLERTDGALQG